jgi:hypothetical protein
MCLGNTLCTYVQETVTLVESWGVRNIFEAGIDKDMDRRSRIVLYARRYGQFVLLVAVVKAQWHKCALKIVEVEVNLRPTVSRPVCLGARHPSGTRDQFFVLLEISFR